MQQLHYSSMPCPQNNFRMNSWFLVVLFYGLPTVFMLSNTELNHFDKSFKQFSLVNLLLFFFCLYRATCENNSISNNSF